MKSHILGIRFHFIEAAVLAALIVAPAPVSGAEIKENAIAPNITLRDLHNRLVFGRAVLKEKPILVSFFYTACVPCKKEIPELEKLHAKYGRKIAFFLIATDKEGADAVEPYVRRMGVTIPVLIDKYSDAAKDFGVDKYPALFIIGRDGKVRYAGYGYKEETIWTVEEVIKGLR